ncbi:ABC transporter ATP-binding protein [Frankia sp. CNm7]|uniref:ABC transporter ATP-binding protein n=1 Tax=Frankia nepalensis TaxID=1836974 RepID=A0A937RQ35_9ACTN|nr:ABC transporter ATP-binding protein [Frankia nepalensis]MBL7498890.1 ABC transporter ATP-binding protein [Frankia nepalensis]MBL7512565.1 ABC transporter ATP-binding protein [Frankia nepalensis]MBL7524253.1 ABC transporter ATP-binding protein [Frankia nepalensis]MBL7632920.1 ABC transporter ATP-binding protein [Frankia nepalensis]
MDKATRRARHAGLRSYLRFTATFRRPLALVIALFVVADVLIAIIPLFIGRFVATLDSNPIPHDDVVFYTAALIACSVGHDLFWRGAELFYMKLLNPRGFDYQNLLFRRVVHQEYPFFADRATGKIGGYVRTLGQEYRDFLDNTCFNYVELVVRLPSIVIIMFAVNVPTGLLFTGAIALLFLIGRYTARRSAKEEKGFTDVNADMESYILDVVANFVSVKSFRRERVEHTLVVERRHAVVKAANRSMFWAIVFWGSMSLVVRYLIWPTAILLNLYLFLHGRLTIGELTTFLAALVIFSDYIWAMIWEFSQLNLRLARVEEAYGYLFGDREILDPKNFPDADAPGPEEIPAQAAIGVAATRPRDDGGGIGGGPLGSLELRGITFAYPDNSAVRVLDGVTLTLAPHEKVGIVGRSGSGKTTLLKLLLGYYPLPLGMIALDGRPLPNRQLARAISYVPQDISLFHRSIRDNITYGALEGIADEEVERAARRAHAHDFIVRAAKGYDTLVGERGIRLSTGQRQRIAIARAFLDHKPLLVLDEATSALDSESELLVQHALEELWRERTVIAVAHRLSTLLRMDRIVVLDAGRIVEQGSHEHLLDAEGHYYRLWQQQSGEMLVND